MRKSSLRGLSYLPALRSEVFTHIVRTVPSEKRIFLRCAFVLNVRLLMPVVLRPIPPDFLGRPLRVILLPEVVFLAPRVLILAMSKSL